jgi:hypothetical protein
MYDSVPPFLKEADEGNAVPNLPHRRGHPALLIVHNQCRVHRSQDDSKEARKHVQTREPLVRGDLKLGGRIAPKHLYHTD